MGKEEIYDVIVIGAGPAGMSAALYASRANLKTLIIEGGLPGGQMNNTDRLDNYLGFPEADASTLAEEMYKQALSFGAKEVVEFVRSVEEFTLTEGKHFKVSTKRNKYVSRTVILATGTQYKTLDVPGEDALVSKGISYCAVCDAPFYKGKNVAVIGGGDSALEEADYISQFAEQVVIFHRRKDYRAKPSIQERVLNNPKIISVMNTIAREFKGKDKLDSIRIHDRTMGKERDFMFDGAFIYIGNVPQTDIVKGFDILTDEGYIDFVVPDTMMTRVDGLFAVGDILDKHIRQVAKAVGEGAVAGQSAFYYLKQKDSNKQEEKKAGSNYV